MFLHRYSNNRDLVDIPITLKEAFTFLEEQDSKVQDEDNFIGFTHPLYQDAFIQFIREDNENWIIDIPVFKNDTYQGSLIGDLKHDTVFLVVKEFFDNQSPFQKYLTEKKYKSINTECKSKWGIFLKMVKED